MVLVLALAVTLFPVTARASGDGSGVGSDVTLEGDTSFGSLLTNTVNASQTQQSQESYDSRICDMTVEGTTATVEYSTTVEANLVVAIYTEDGSKLLGSGVTPVSPEETVATVEIEISAMPYYFKAGAYLLDARTNDPVSGEFKTERYTKTMQDILAATVDDFNPELVLNLDDDRTTNFAVFNENTLLAESGDSQNRITDNGDGTYTIENADEQFLAMQPGDTFAYTYPDGTVLIVNAASVSVSGTTITVTDNPDADLSMVFDFVKIEEDSNDKAYTYDDSTLSDGLTVISDEEFEADLEGVSAAAFGRGVDVDAEGSIDTNFKVSHKVLEKDDYDVSISGKVAFKLTVNLKLYLKFSYQYVEFSCDYSLSGKIAITGKLSLCELPMGKFDICLCTGVYAHVSPSFVVEASTELSYEISCKGTIGVAYDSDWGGFDDTSSRPSVKKKVEFSGELSVGLKAELDITAVSKKICKLSGEGAVSIEISAAQLEEGLSTPSGSEVHLCVDCIEGRIDFAASLSTEVNLFGDFFEEKWTIAEANVKLKDFYDSRDFGDWDFTKCPHIAYETTITALSQSKNPIPDVAIRLYQNGEELAEVILLDEYLQTMTGAIPVTDEDGCSTIYLQDGTYTLRAEYDGQEYEGVFTIHGATKKAEMIFEIPELPDELILSENEVSLGKLGDTAQLTAAFKGTDVTETCQWSSSDEKIVTASAGLLKAVGEGTATVTVTYSQSGRTYSAECMVTVTSEETIAFGQCGENLTWTLNNAGTLTISGSGQMYHFTTYSGSPWYEWRSKIKNISIQSGVTSIGDYAFHSCYSSTSVTIPGSVTSIGKSAFGECSRLTSVTIPEGVTSILDGTFGGCTQLTSVAIPDSVTSIGKYAFLSCYKLTSVTIPDGVTSISDYVFRGCESLTSVVIPDGVTRIGQEAFYECESLTSVTIPDSVSSIGSYAFNRCESLISVTIPDGVTRIPQNTFSFCSSLTSVTIPDSVAYIDNEAFYGCSSLTSVTIPDSVTNIGNSAFRDCSSLTSVTIPKGVTCIWGYVFDGCTELASVTIPESVSKIEYYAFDRCDKLAHVYYGGTQAQWAQITIGTYNDALANATIHCGDGTISSVTATVNPDAPKTVEEPMESTTEPTTEPVTEPAAETEAAEAPTAGEVSDIQWYMAPAGAKMTVQPVLQRLSAFTGTESSKNGMRSVKFTGLEPGEEYVLIVSIVPGSLVPADLQYIDQDNAAADGTLSFTYIPREDVSATVQLYGIPAGREITLDREYITMEAGAAVQKISASVTPLEWQEELVWSAENPEGTQVISVNEYGDVTPIAPGTAYAVATVTHGAYTFSARCRVDVTEKRANLEVTGVQLGTAALTTELFSTQYASFDVVLLLEQNLSALSENDRPEDNGVSVTSARFENEAADGVFDLVVKDDRTLEVVPKRTAILSPGSVQSSYISKLVVNVCGAEYVTADSLKLTVKKTMPKLKASTLTFNSFYTGQSQAIVIPGVTATGFAAEALPQWLSLSPEGVLTLTDSAPTKSASGKANVLVETREWAIPIPVSVAVKIAYKAPALKLSASSVTIPTFAKADDQDSYGAGQWVQLLCKNKSDTLESLNVSWIEAPEGWYPQQEDQPLSETDGYFFLKPVEGRQVVPGKLTLKVHFRDTDAVAELPLTVKTKQAPLAVHTYLTSAKLNLNSTIEDGFFVSWYMGPQYVELSQNELTWDVLDKWGNSVKDTFNTYMMEDGRLAVLTTERTEPGTYELYLDLCNKETKARKTEESTVLKITVLSGSAKPGLSIKALDVIDFTFPNPQTRISLSFKNFFLGRVVDLKYTVINGKEDVTDQFGLAYDDSIYSWVLTPKGEVPTGSYTLNLSVAMDERNPTVTTAECSAKFTVKRTPVKLKLSQTSLSLNKTIGDTAAVTVSCTTKGYDLTKPVIWLMDSTGKNSAEGCLDLTYSSGCLTVGTNDATRYGATYKLLIQATAFDKPVTLTVKIPAQQNSKVTASLKASGAIDVIRDASSVIVRPTYKNYAGLTPLEKVLTIFSSADGKTYAEDVTSHFRITPNADGSYTVTKLPGEQLNAGLKYRAVLTLPGVANSDPAYVSLPVKSGSAPVKLSGTAVLYKNDRFSRSPIPFTVTDGAMNPISRVEIKDPKLAQLYEVYSYGNGEFAIGFKNDTVGAGVKSGNVALEVYVDGNASAKSNASVTLKLNIR